MKHVLAFIAALMIFMNLYAGKVDTVQVFSSSMQKNIKCVIITPDNAGKKTYPVLYLLHGFGGNQAQWIGLKPELKTQVDELGMIIVCPDGFTSWYLDSPVDSSFRYETFVSHELIEYIDAHYKTVQNRTGRAITGLSMGGHGGMYLSIRHKDIFGAAGSTSGGVDLRPFPNGWQLKLRLGDTICCKQNWEDHSVINLVNTLKNNELKLVIDCGLGDFFLDVNRNLHRKLQELKIDHDYTERPGVHNSAYWNNSIDYQLLFFKKYFTVR